MHLLLKFLCNENNEINTAEIILDLAFVSQCLFEFFYIEMWNNLVAIVVFRSENNGYQAWVWYNILNQGLLPFFLLYFVIAGENQERQGVET